MNRLPAIAVPCLALTFLGCGLGEVGNIPKPSTTDSRSPTAITTNESFPQSFSPLNLTTIQNQPLKISSAPSQGYSFVDLSQSYCGPCKSLAEWMGTNQAFRDAIAKPACNTITITPSHDIAAWVALQEVNDEVASHSYQLPSSLSFDDVPGFFGIPGEVSGIPYVFIVDNATGQVHETRFSHGNNPNGGSWNWGQLRDEFMNLCSAF